MSSIRDALKKAERERLAREGRPTSASEPTPVKELERAPLSVVSEPAIPVAQIPGDIAQELAHFRQGVETALPQASRAIVLASANPSEGVTTIANYLAASLALRDNKRTLLVDANFDGPRTSSMLGLLGKKGLSDYCMGRAELTEVLVRTESPQFYVMGLGTDNLNPSLVMSSMRARTLAKDLTQRFEYVLFDASSILAHAETSMLAAYADGVVLVVRANRTKREVLSKANRIIRFSGGRVLGTVLNRRTFPIPDTIYRRL